MGPRLGALHTLQHDRSPSSGMWRALLFLSGRLARAHKQSVQHSGGKSYWCWKIAERCQLRCRTTTVRLLCDAIFLTTRRRHSENFNEKLKLASALKGAQAA
jgi:hypothetical protein